MSILSASSPWPAPPRRKMTDGKTELESGGRY